ncbi:MAG: hypothetical protein ACE5IH_03175 [Thermodesulfobacteriota bacterium]
MKLNGFLEAAHIASHIEIVARCALCVMGLTRNPRPVTRNSNIAIAERSIAKFQPLIILVTLFLLLSPSILPAQDIFQQKEGFGYIYWEDIRSARERAIKDALKKVVMDTVQETVESMTFNRDREVLEERYSFRPEKYIKEYRILSEDMIEEAFIKISLEAIVARDVLKDDLSAMGIPLGIIPLPRILIMMGEKRKNETSSMFWWRPDMGPLFSLSSLIFYAELTEAGFDVIDPFTPSYKNSVFDPRLQSYKLKREDVRTWGYIYGADIVIYGETRLNILGTVMGSYKELYRFSTLAKIMDVHTGEEIFSEFAQKGFVSDKKNAVEMERVLRKFSKEVVNGFVLKLMDSWKEKEGVTIHIEVLLTGVDNYDQYVVFKRALSNMRDRVISIREKRFSSGNVLMDIEIKGSPFFFKEDLQVLDIEGASLTLSFFSRDRINLMIVTGQQETK